MKRGFPREHARNSKTGSLNEKKCCKQHEKKTTTILVHQAIEIFLTQGIREERNKLLLSS